MLLCATSWSAMAGWPGTKSIARQNPSACTAAKKQGRRGANISRRALSFPSIATGWMKRSQTKTRPPQASGFNTSNYGLRIPIQASSGWSFRRRRRDRCSAAIAQCQAKGLEHWTHPVRFTSMKHPLVPGPSAFTISSRQSPCSVRCPRGNQSTSAL